MLFLATLVAFLCALPLAEPAPCITLRRARIHPRGHPDKCLAIEAEAVLPYKFGQWVQIRSCQNQQGFTWLVDSKLGSGGILKLEGTGDVDWCLNAGTHYHVTWLPQNGSEAQLAYCGDTVNGEPPNRVIKWTSVGSALKYSSGFEDYYFCLDNADGKLTEGNKVQIWQCAAGNPNQQWDIEYL